MTTVKLANDAVAETKLAAAVRTKLNATPVIADGSVTTPKLADSAVTTAKLGATSVTDAKVATGISQAKITNLTTDLASKASVASVTAKADAVHTHTLDSLSNVNVTGATAGQSLVFQGSQWSAATVTSGGSGVTDHGALTGLTDDDHTQYHTNTRGDARYYQKSEVDTAVGGRVATTVQVATTGSLAGGGALSGNRTLSLSGDSATPGNSKYYGKNGSGAKGFYDLPAGGGGGASSPLTAVQVSADYTASAGQWLICDTTASGYDVTLPSPTNGAWVKVKKMTNNVNAVLVYPSAGSGQISAGSMTSNTISVNSYGQSYDFFADGTQWHVA
ncbi:MAG: hypothetical protein ABIR91_00470 [Candidatus Saccharimonadales bacterium]